MSRVFEVRLAFQPVVRVADLSVFGYEALFRGAADPGGFFARAVRESFAPEVDREVCRLVVARFAAGGAGVLFVNLTPPTFLCPDGAVEALRPLLPGRVVVEVTEQAFPAVPGGMAAAAAWWRREGFLLAVDDVGLGQSRLLALAEVVPEFVKVDRPLLLSALGGGPGREVLRHLLALVRSLGAVAVAEGVESEEELALVRALGFDLAQGYLLGVPGPLPGCD